MRRAILYLTLLFAIPGCSNDAPEPAVEPGTRIVTLSPAAANILIDLEQDHLIVGRHNYDTALDAAIPPVGDQSAYDYERILDLKPTHVIVQTESQPVPPRLIEFSESAHFEILNISTLALEDILLSARTLEREFAPDAGLSGRFERAIRHRPTSAIDVGGVLVVMHTSPTVDVLGPGSAHQDIVERLGFAAAVTDGKPYMPLDAEDILAINPGVIVLIRPRAAGSDPAGENWQPTDEDLGIMSGLGLSAVEHGRVVLIDDPQALASGTSLIGVIQTLSHRLGAIGPLRSQHNERDANTTEAGPG